MKKSTVAIAGWLFADLLLGLMMLSIASMSGVQVFPTPTPTLPGGIALTRGPTPTPSPTPTRTFTPTPTATPTITATPLPFGLNSTPFIVTITADISAFTCPTPGASPAVLPRVQAERARIRDQLNQSLQPLAGRSAGFILTFATAPTQNPCLGNVIAEEVNRILMTDPTFASFSARLVPPAPYHELVNTPTDYGRVTIEIYLYNR